MKIYKRSAVKHQLKTIALGSGANVSFGWSNYEGNEQGDYSACIINDGVIHRVQFTHEELAVLVRYWNETEAGTRAKHHISSATIGDHLPGREESRKAQQAVNTAESQALQRMNTALCSRCGGSGWMKIQGGSKSQVCPECCTHSEGGWLLSSAYAGYMPGYDTYACKNGCGTILKQLERV
jgi:hypothetical protein